MAVVPLDGTLAVRTRARASRVRGAAKLAAAMALAAWAPSAAAQSCHGLAATNLVFTNYTPFGPGVAATATITYNCPPPLTQAWIAISTPRTMNAGGNSLQFEVYGDATHLAVWPDAPPQLVPASKSGSVTIYGFLPPQDAAAGSYAGTLTVSIYTGTTQNQTATATLAVSTSNFVNTCIIGAGTLAFGTYDPLGANAAGPLDAQGTIQIACTRATSYAVGLGAGNFASGTTRQMASGAQRLPYELYTDAGRGTVWNGTSTVSGTAPSTSPITLTVYGRIAGGQTAGAGSYSDTVQSTINF